MRPTSTKQRFVFGGFLQPDRVCSFEHFLCSILSRTIAEGSHVLKLPTRSCG